MYKSPKFPVKRLVLVGEFISASLLPSGNSACAVPGHDPSTRFSSWRRAPSGPLGVPEVPE